VSETQIRIKDALSPIWKVLLMNRLFHIVGWKQMTLAMIFRPRNGANYEDIVDGEETCVIENYDPDCMIPWEEYEEEASCFNEDINKAKKVPLALKNGTVGEARRETEGYLKSTERKVEPKMSKRDFTKKQKAYEVRLFRQKEKEEANIIPKELRGIK
jgi:hypothetical protein